MDKIVNFKKLKETQERTNYRNLLIEKYLYLKLNIKEISGVCGFIDPTGNLLCNIVNSILLENVELELTNGYQKVKQIRLNYRDFKLVDNNATLGSIIWHNANKLIDNNEFKKYRIMNIYLDIDGQVDDLEKEMAYNPCQGKIDLVKMDDNDFINEWSSCNMPSLNIESIKEIIRKGKGNYENKRH